MCPDKETLSAYIDGELDHKWNNAIHSHIDECSSCSREIDLFGSLAGFLHSDAGEVLEAQESARNRVWQGIRRTCDRRHYLPVPFRRFELPLPALALIAVFCIVLGAAGTLWLAGGVPGSEKQIASLETNQNMDFSSAEELIAFLERSDQGVNITIQLPKEPVFIVVGEPQLLRTADYRRGE